MGCYGHESKASFRKKEHDGYGYYDDERAPSVYEIWAGYGRQWKRKVGTVEKVTTYDDDDYSGDNPKTHWNVDLDCQGFYNDNECRFSTLTKAKNAVKDALDGGTVWINNSTDEDYLSSITSRRYDRVHHGD